MLLDHIKKEKIHPAFDPFTEQNKIYFDIIEKIADFAYSNNLDYCFTGGLALVFIHRKMFRTISDIDININVDQIDLWAKFFKEQYNCDLTFRSEVGTWTAYMAKFSIGENNFSVDLFTRISPERIRSFSPYLLKKIEIEGKTLYVSDIFLGFKDKLKREKDLLDITYYNINHIDPFDREDQKIKQTDKIKVFRIKT